MRGRLGTSSIVSVALLAIVVAAALPGCAARAKVETSAPKVGETSPTTSAELTRTTPPATTDLTSPAPAEIDDPLHIPPKGSAERKAILDVLRVRVQKDLGQPVVFKINRIAVHSSFAFVNAMPLEPDGDEIDYSKTKFAQALEEGVFDGGVLALLKRSNGTWTVLEYALGATDFPGDYWAEQHGAPSDIVR